MNNYIEFLADRKAKKTIILIALFFLSIVFVLAIRIVNVATNSKNKVHFLFFFQEIEVSFINSVTNRPVKIVFKPLWRFSQFKATTDSETASYYTFGAYDWNTVLARENQARLTYCSISGIRVKVGGSSYDTNGSCITVETIWP